MSAPQTELELSREPGAAVVSARARFPCVVIDPPWEYPGGFNGFGKRRALPYRAMPLEDIAALPLGQIVAREGYAFIWTTNKYLPAALAMLAGWRLTYRQTVTWCKHDVGGLGGMFGTNTEFVVIAQRIGPRSNARGQRTKGERIPTSWFQWPKGRHSEKPAEFFATVERLVAGPYLEIFARAPRAGWTCVGDEIDGRDVRAALRGAA